MAKTKTPSFGAGPIERLRAKVSELTEHVEAADNLAESQAKVIFNLRQELTELREYVAEMNLRLVFTMRQMQFRRKSSAIADASGVVPTVVETLMDRYHNGGRDTILAALEAENAAIEQQEKDATAKRQTPAATPSAEPNTLEPTEEDAERIKSGRTN